MTEEQKTTESTEIESAKPTAAEQTATTTELTSEEKNWAVLAHASAFIGLIIPFGQVLAPLFIYVFKKDSSQYVNDNAIESVNFQITFTIALFISALLMSILIGFLIFPIVFVVGAIFIIMASIKASKGEKYSYPLSLRLFS